MRFGKKDRDLEDDRPGSGAVWIVRHDQSPYNTVLGVFATRAEASAFAEEVGPQFADGVIFSCFALGYRFDRGPGHVKFAPEN